MNSIKKKEIIGLILVMVIGSAWHYVFEWTGNIPAVGALAPVNEST